MSNAQAWLIVGGMFNLFFSTLAAFALYWVRLRDVEKPVPRYGLIAHTSSITMGVLLIALSAVIEHTHFAPFINTGLAIAALVATLLTDTRNLMLWAKGVEDGFRQVDEKSRRLRGASNMINLVVMAAIFYGVLRTALGI